MPALIDVVLLELFQHLVEILSSFASFSSAAISTCFFFFFFPMPFGVHALAESEWVWGDSGRRREKKRQT